MDSIASWCEEHRITEVECLVSDFTGIPRGKILPTEKFIKGNAEDSHRIPESAFILTATGSYPDTDDIDKLVDMVDVDVVLRPDPTTIRPVPWYEDTDGASHLRLRQLRRQRRRTG